MQVLLQFKEKNSGNHDWHSSGTVQENREHCFRRGSVMTAWFLFLILLFEEYCYDG